MNSQSAKPPQTKKIEELNEWYREAEECDKELYAEMRTNIQLVAGDHYNRSQSKVFERARDAKAISPEQHVRITKNHIGKITKLYRNSILSQSPGVAVSAKDEKELKHQKAAEQHTSVKHHIDQTHKLKKKIALWAKDYIELGEVWVKVFWDPNLGTQIGWHQAVDPITGQPMVDPITGQPVSSGEPIMSGDLIFQTIHGFDVLRDASAKTMDESLCVGIRSMQKVKELKKKFANNPEIDKLVSESAQDTYRVFKGSNATYKELKGMCMVREYYFRPCAEYPKGYFYITTEKGILQEGELPFGIFPIQHEVFDEITTSPRGHSIIKPLRPCQIEINRKNSQMAQIQLTLGMDRVWLQSGAKTGSGGTKPGVRVDTYTGATPIVVPGSIGAQYLDSIDKDIAEMYKLADVFEDMEEKATGDMKPYTLLFRSMKQKKKFNLYSTKFEDFLCQVYMTAFKLFKIYAPEQLVIPVIGKSEQVNLAEFKQMGDLEWQIKAEPQVEDAETKMGKQVVLDHVLQYVGNSLGKEDIGKFLRLSPFLNHEQMFQDFTLEYDNAVNDMLALDRGEVRQVGKYDDHPYQIKMLTSRTKKADFRFLPPQIQQGYEIKIRQHELAENEKLKAIKAAESQFIPSGGYLVVCDLYVPDPADPAKTKRVKIPSEAVQWLITQLDTQGSSQEALQQLPSGAISDLSQMFVSSVQGSPIAPQGAPNNLV